MLRPLVAPQTADHRKEPHFEGCRSTPVLIVHVSHAGATKGSNMSSHMLIL